MAEEDKARVDAPELAPEDDPQKIAEALSTLGMADGVDVKRAQKLKEEKKEANKNIEFDFADIIRGHIRQDVETGPLIRVTFQSMNGEEEEWINEKMGSAMGKSEAYMNTRYRNLQLCHGIVNIAMKGQVMDLPKILVNPETDVIDDESVFKKLRVMRRALPMTVLNHIFLHYGWFLARAHDMYMRGEVKNG